MRIQVISMVLLMTVSVFSQTDLLGINFDDGTKQGGSVSLCRQSADGPEPSLAQPGLGNTAYRLSFPSNSPPTGDRWQIAWKLANIYRGDVTVRALIKPVTSGRGFALNLRDSAKANVAKVGLGFGAAGYISVHNQPDDFRTTSLAYRTGEEGILEFAYVAASAEIRVRYNGVEDNTRSWAARGMNMNLAYLELDNEVGGPGEIDQIEVSSGAFPESARTIGGVAIACLKQRISFFDLERAGSGISFSFDQSGDFRIDMYGLSGKFIASSQGAGSQSVLPLPSGGIYLVSVRNESSHTRIKLAGR